jgi:hypothetical protein
MRSRGQRGTHMERYRKRRQPNNRIEEKKGPYGRIEDR